MVKIVSFELYYSPIMFHVIMHTTMSVSKHVNMIVVKIELTCNNKCILFQSVTIIILHYILIFMSDIINIMLCMYVTVNFWFSQCLYEIIIPMNTTPTQWNHKAYQMSNMHTITILVPPLQTQDVQISCWDDYWYNYYIISLYFFKLTFHILTNYVSYK